MTEANIPTANPDKFPEDITVEQLRQKSVEVFGDSKKAESWFTQPCLALNDVRPDECFDTMANRHLVMEVLLRIEWGIYS
jgi:putative toxin-antitoxin system antitoxin component (TIGR02293 family)